jgi:NAD(P)-dependent dehydrogenase (short-subunit alcohol dehydrogenase family)
MLPFVLLKGGRAEQLDVVFHVEHSVIALLYVHIYTYMGKSSLLFAPIESVTEDEFHRQFNSNVLGLLLATREAVKYFGPEGGSVINIGSVASRIAPPLSSIYSATKGAVDAVTAVLAKELGPRKIRVNSM